MTSNLSIPPHIKKSIEAGVSGLDIIHGELKTLMIEAEEAIRERQVEYSDSYDLGWVEGMLEAYAKIYQLTYDLSFGGAK